MKKTLIGRRIALAEHRELDRLAALLEAEGATVARYPLLAITDAPDPAPVEAWVRDLAAGRFDDLIFLTGEGVQRLIATADRLGLRDDALRALSRARKVTRGPKPARALHALGLTTDIPSSVPTSAGIVDALRAHVLRDRRIGVQLFGDDPGSTLVSFLLVKGAQVVTVAPYRYAPAVDDVRITDLIQELTEGRIDVIVFTSAMQITRLFAVARTHAAEATLQAGLARTHVAAIGPLAVDALRAENVRVDTVPARQFFMRRLVNDLVAALGSHADQTPPSTGR